MNCVSDDGKSTFYSSDFLSGQYTGECPDCKNNVNRTDVKNMGPIPIGTYKIEPKKPGTARPFNS